MGVRPQGHVNQNRRVAPLNSALPHRLHNVVRVQWTCSDICVSDLQVEKFGKPTWRRLVEAVKDHVGGNNVALAQTIAREHPDVLP